MMMDMIRRIMAEWSRNLPRCSYGWAKSVLLAMAEGTVEQLERKKKRKTAITETGWPARVVEALRDPTSVRTTPGKSYVSVGFKNRQPLVLLTRTKREILEGVVRRYREEEGELGEVEERVPSISTLLTLIPRNYRQPRPSDQQANVCVKHENLTYLVTKLRAVIPSLPLSSKELAGLAMCPPSAARPYSLLDPLTWPQDCSLR